MYKIILLITFFHLHSFLVLAQESQPVLKDYYIDLGLVYGFDSGIGFNSGYSKLSVKRGGVSLYHLSFTFRDDGIDTWGPYYSSIGQNQFPEDIIDTGYTFMTGHALIGIKVNKTLHVIGGPGYHYASFVQKRKDDFTILGNNGRYHTSYSDPDKSNFGAAVGIKLFLPMTETLAFTPSAIVSTLSIVSISIGLGF